MTEENEINIIKLPDSDPIPEILIIETESGNEMSMNECYEEENINEKEMTDNSSAFDEEYSPFSSFPDSTPNSEHQIIEIKYENIKKESIKERSNIKNRSNCCLLI